MNEKILIVRDRATGRAITIPTNSIPGEISPDNWFENPCWQYRPDREDLEPLILAYLSKDFLGPRGIQQLAQYIVDYACHIACIGYIFAPEKLAYRLNVDCIRKLRALRAKAKTLEDLREMIRVGMDYALDPL